MVKLYYSGFTFKRDERDIQVEKFYIIIASNSDPLCRQYHIIYIFTYTLLFFWYNIMCALYYTFVCNENTKAYENITV